MIRKLTGIIDEKNLNTIIVDVNGVGYLVYVSKKTIQKLPDHKEKTSLLIEHVIKQDDQMLCGFFDNLERDWFNLLTSVQGVGVKVALSILSYLTTDEIADAIARQHAKAFTQADGVGAKVASRIMLELKSKIPESYSFVEGINHLTQRTTERKTDDALSALLNLGYVKSEATQAINLAYKQNQEATTQDLIRLGLQNLSRRPV